MSNTTPYNNYPNYPQDYPSPGGQSQQPPLGYPTYPTNPTYPPYPTPQQYPAQPPNYAPYASPDYPNYPGYPPMFQPPRKKSSVGKVLLIIGGIVGVLLLLCVGGLFVLFATPNAFSDAYGTSFTASFFCSSEKSADYPQAYQQLSSTLQQQYTQDKFTQDGQAHDSSLGQISSCNALTPTVHDTSATLTLVVTRTLNGVASTINGQVTLVKEGNSWKIDSVDSSLNML